MTPVWIDTDPAIGLPDRDVDDGLALVQAFHSTELAIRGVSAVFGNVSLDEALPIAETIVARFGPPGLRVYRGAARRDDLGVETPASQALASALERERLAILALGPVTTVATVLMRRPDLASRITSIVAVAGRRPGQRFTTGATNPRGHRDFNFEQDPDAFGVVLAHDVDLVLAPFEVSSKVWLTDRDLDVLDHGGEAARWLAPPARRWLHLWRRVFDVDGFNPFDTLAVACLATPDMLGMTDLPVHIRLGPDDATEARMQGEARGEKPFLEVSAALTGVSRHARYCHDVSDGFKADLLARLAGRLATRS